MKVETVINNFTRGQLDHDLNGRFELPFYFNGFEICRNFISNYKGNLKNKTGFEYKAKPRNNKKCRLVEFRFNTEQSYLLEFTDNFLRFYTYDKQGRFGYVVDDKDNIVEIETGIAETMIDSLQKAQNADVMYLTQREINPKKLKRTSANTFQIINATPSGLNFTDLGYPACCSFAGGGLWYGGFAKKPTTIARSKVTDYDNFTIPTSNIKDDDALRYTLAEITDPILWIFGGKLNLYVGNAQGITIVNGGTYDQPITSTAVNADLANNDGSSGVYPVQKDGLMFYVSLDKQKVYSFDYDLLTEKFVSSDLNLLAEEIAHGNIKQMAYKRDKNNLIYMLLENGKMLALLYNKEEQITGWYPIETAGTIESLSTITRPDGKDDLFIAVNRSGTRYIEKLADEVTFSKFHETANFLTDTDKAMYNRIIAEELKNCIYLDNASVYLNLYTSYINLEGTIVTCEDDVFLQEHINHYIVYKTKSGAEHGCMRIVEVLDSKTARIEIMSDEVTPTTWEQWYISFNAVGNLEDLEGKTVSVVADGGYLNEFVVKNGKIQLDREVTSCVVGLPYMSIIKTFNLGFSAQGVNFQTSNKVISDFIMRLVNSAGVEVGTSLDNMQQIQQFNPTGFFDLPPLPLDGDNKIIYTDTSNCEKSIFIIQRLPVPMNVTMLQFNVNYGRMS